MQREIKFRAWDEQQKIMHHDFQCIKSGEEGNDWILFISDKQKLTGNPHLLENPYFSQQLKVMQFTGLKDKNGKDIYEGDILEYSVFDFNDNDSQYKGVVKWFGAGFIVTQIPDNEGNGEYGIELFWVHNQDCELERIGNIHENPKLIK